MCRCSFLQSRTYDGTYSFPANRVRMVRPTPSAHRNWSSSSPHSEPQKRPFLRTRICGRLRKKYTLEPSRIPLPPDDAIVEVTTSKDVPGLVSNALPLPFLKEVGARRLRVCRAYDVDEFILISRYPTSACLRI